ncbi:MAG: NAD(P)-binding domain-containing protein [Gemmatimonadaceae bacterium]
MPTSNHEFTDDARSRVERYETLVIGGGQAGLSVAHHLASREMDFTVVTDETRIGDNWRRRWDSLRLFTPAERSGLPGMRFPAPAAHFADKDEMADYLERYAGRFDLPVRTGTHVESLRHDGTRYRLQVLGATLEADNVVVATGAFHRGRIPGVANQLATHIHQVHSSGYRSPFTLPLGSVLVVGAGNSGSQIALELAKHRKVWLSGRDTGYMPRRVLGRDVFDWIWPLMTLAHQGTAAGRKLMRGPSGGDARIGITELDLRRAGVTRVERLTGVRGGLPVCGDEVMQPNVIVWCTGFEPAYEWIDLPAFGGDGLPRHVRGESLDMPGLYFAGLKYQHRMTSSLVGGVGADAEWVADRIARRMDALAAA